MFRCKEKIMYEGNYKKSNQIQEMPIPATIEEYNRIMSEPIKDNINHPTHYNKGKIEVWDFIADQQLNWFEGNIIKYVARSRYKGEELADLKKAQQNIEKLIKGLEEKTNVAQKN